MSTNSNNPGSAAGSTPKPTPSSTTTSRAAPQQEQSARPWFPTPNPIRRLFANFPLHTLPAEALPASPHDVKRTSDLASPEQRSGNDELPVLHVFNHPADANQGAPSFNPSCLQYQAWLRVHGVKTRSVVSSNHAAPDGVLPFIVLPRHQKSRKEHGGLFGGNKGREGLKGGSKGESTGEVGDTGVGVSSNTIKEGLGISGKTTSSKDKLDAHDVPIASGKLWDWAAEQAGQRPSDARRKGNSMQQAREQAYISLVEHRLRAAWLLALYLTPANFPVAASLYIHPTTSSPLVHSLQASSLISAAREALHNLSPTTGSSRLVNPTPLRPLTLLPHTVTTSLPSALVSPEFPSDEDARRIYDAASQALDSLAELLGDDVWFFGTESPGRLDVVVFSYVHLMIGHGRLKDQWVDPQWINLGDADKKGRLRLRRHWERMMEACEWY